MSNDNKHMPYPPSHEEMSTCCGAPPLGDTHKSGDDLVGICSDCRDHALFEMDGDEDESLTAVNSHAALVEALEAHHEVIKHLCERDWFKDPGYVNEDVICGLDTRKVRAAVEKYEALAAAKGGAER